MQSMTQNAGMAVAIGTLYIGCAAAAAQTDIVRDPLSDLERTSFQTSGPYDPRVDIKSDVAMVYGFGGNFTNRVEGWRSQGYRVHLMTGVAWGEYQDYFSGKWDGVSHQDEAQTDKRGNLIQHGPTVPYVAPSVTYGKYLCGGVQRALDAGVEAIHLEEPEFWVRGGYSGSFKKEWQSYYGEAWQPPHSSPDAQYRASKLKYFLYRRALEQVFSYVVQDNDRRKRETCCYVPTHSMINYAHWRIVSPEQSLVMLKGCDGYIGQVWTGTARTANQYKGLLKERTFETAFLEYGSLQNLVRSTGRRMYFLNDPVEDNPDHSWDDYRRNWESTLVASLLWPDVWRYEVAPWPERPFLHKYPAKDLPNAGEKAKRVGISPEYATELNTVFNTLNDMKQEKVQWDCGVQGLGVLVSDTMMFQRGEPNDSDPHLGSFYGLALPLVKNGCPAQPVQLENIGLPGYLEGFKVLFLTYEGMKPPKAQLHVQLAEWVKAGGVLVVVDDDADPYNKVREWWNSDGLAYATPRLHLLDRLGVKGESGLFACGRGTVILNHSSPAKLAREAQGADTVLNLAQQACTAAGVGWKKSSHLLLYRGPYVIAAGLDESDVESVKELTGKFVNLFDPKLAVASKVALAPGSRFLLLDLDKLDLSKPRLIASASKTLEFSANQTGLRFHSEGPDQTMAATRVSLAKTPTAVRVRGLAPDKIAQNWDAQSKTLLIEHPNSAQGQWVEIEF
jgi:hypothetical protein